MERFWRGLDRPLIYEEFNVREVFCIKVIQRDMR